MCGARGGQHLLARLDLLSVNRVRKKIKLKSKGKCDHERRVAATFQSRGVQDIFLCTPSLRCSLCVRARLCMRVCSHRPPTAAPASLFQLEVPLDENVARGGPIVSIPLCTVPLTLMLKRQAKYLGLLEVQLGLR